MSGIFYAVVFFSSGLLFSSTATADSVSDCSRIEDDSKRLECFDLINSSPPPEYMSYLTKLWELDTDAVRGKYAIMPHRSTYVLPVSYNHNPNVEPLQAADPNADLLRAEVKFQISMKVKLWQDILGNPLDLWFGYTQKSFWQLYNFADSAPFRETNYEPEFLLNFRTDYNVFDLMRLRIVNLGLNHQSNGSSEPLSRSWNRILAEFGFERTDFTVLLKAWYRIPEEEEEDDNPEMDDYLGYGELRSYYFFSKHRMGIMLRNNLKRHDNRGAMQLEWSIPFLEKTALYIQYFIGYGESLLDYDHSINRISIGFILMEWD
ncbi:MAG: phospholipase A [Proteobacteria bacterium]|nr:phospholipase A [Pseudomonadota bacterium]MBU1710898.1 phospholipase A [Pseudomonadota bacterium]